MSTNDNFDSDLSIWDYDEFSGRNPPGISTLEDSDDYKTWGVDQSKEQLLPAPTYKKLRWLVKMPDGTVIRSAASEPAAPASQAPDPEYVLPVASEKEPRDSPYLQLPFETQPVGFSAMTPRPCEWTKVTDINNIPDSPNPDAVKLYCITASHLTKIGIVSWPDDKKHLKHHDHGLASNPLIAKACMRARCTVHQAKLGANTMNEVMEYYGKATNPKQRGPGNAIGGCWMNFRDFDCTEIVARWLIRDALFKYMPLPYHWRIRHLETWGTNKKPGSVPRGSGRTPEPSDGQQYDTPQYDTQQDDTQQYDTEEYDGTIRITKRVMYVIHGRDLLNPEDKTPDPADP